MSIQVPEEVEGTGIDLYGVAKWSRATIADGKWLQDNTVGPLYENELILASAVYGTSAIAANDIASLMSKTEEICEDMTSTSAKLQSEIDIINAGSDVIDVVGDDEELSAYSGWTTKNDVIKVLCDSAYDDSQTYYRWYGDDTMDPSQSAQFWHYVGGVSPYYTKSEINTYSADARNYVNDVSGSLYGRIDEVSGSLYEKLEQVSGSLYDQIEQASGSLYEQIEQASSSLYDQMGQASGSLYDLIEEASGSLYDRIDVVDEANRLWTSGVSGSLWNRIDDVSGSLYGEIVEASGSLYGRIDQVSGYLYDAIEEASGSNHADIMYVSASVGTKNSVELHGGTYVEVTSATKPDGTISYSADLYTNPCKPLVEGTGISIVEDPSEITISCSAKSNVFLNLNDYSPTTRTLYDDVEEILHDGNEPIIYQLVDNYGTYEYYYLTVKSGYGSTYTFNRTYINIDRIASIKLVVRTSGYDKSNSVAPTRAETANVVVGATSGDLASLDSNGNLEDSRIPKSDVPKGVTAYNALHGNQIVVGSLGSDVNTIYFLFSNP